MNVNEFVLRHGYVFGHVERSNERDGIRLIMCSYVGSLRSNI